MTRKAASFGHHSGTRAPETGETDLRFDANCADSGHTSGP